MKKKFRTVLVLPTIFIIVVIGMIMLLYKYYTLETTSLKRQFFSNLEDVADQKAAQIENWRQVLINECKLTVDNPLIINEIINYINHPEVPEYKTNILKWFKTVQENQNFDNLYLTDSNGNILEYLFPFDTILARHINDYKRIYGSRKEIMFSDFHKSFQNRIHLSLISPIVKESKIIAFVSMTIDPYKDLLPKIKSWPNVSKTSEIILISTKNDSIIYLSELKKRTVIPLELKFPFSQKKNFADMAKSRLNNTSEWQDYMGDEVFGVIRPINNCNWLLIAKTDKSEYFLKLFERTFSTVTILLLMFALGISVFLIVRRNLNLRYYRKLEKDMQTLNEQYSTINSIINSTSNLIFSIDKQYCYTSFNDAYKKSVKIQYDKDIEIGCNYLSYIASPTARQISKQLIDRALNGEHFVTETSIGKGDMMRQYLFTFSPVINQSSDVIGMVLNATDYTELKNSRYELEVLNKTLEEKVIERTSMLREANKELESFSYSVSHDLRAPLRAINGYSKMILEDYGNNLPGEVVEDLSKIRLSIGTMNKLIDDLLEFSRSTRMEIHFSKVDIGAVFVSMFHELSMEVEGRDIELNVGEAPSANADITLIKIMATNLLSNAIKFTRKTKHAVIETGFDNTPGINAYFIKDNGIGFDMKYADKLFTVFQRLHSEKDFEGTGVGLAIVKRIINKHSGRIWVESLAGNGTTFYFTLPEAPDNNSQDLQHNKEL